MTTSIDGTLLASGARSATVQSPKQVNAELRKGLQVVVTVTAVSGSPSLTPVIQGIAPNGGGTYTLFSGSAISGTGVYSSYIAPGASGANRGDAYVPAQWNAKVTHGTADAVTYQVDYSYLNA
jgi:hypothetical protein